MRKYRIIYFDNFQKAKYIGHFMAKSHYRIKFIIYRYLKKILDKTDIIFAIFEIKKNKMYVYEGNFIKYTRAFISHLKVEGFNKVKRIKGIVANNFIKSVDVTTLVYEKTHNHIEKYEEDEIAMSETDSEFEFAND